MLTERDWAEFLETSQAEVRESCSVWHSVFSGLQGGAGLPNFTLHVIHSPTLNAVATWQVAQDSHIVDPKVGISAQLVLFARRMATIASRHFPFRDDTEQAVEVDGISHVAFARLLAEVSGFRQVEIDDRSLLSTKEDLRDLSTACRRLALGQVTGHEVAHIWLGHVNQRRGPAREALSSVGAMRVEEVFRCQAEELDADFHGMLAQLRWAETAGYRPALAIWAGDYLLAALQFWNLLENRVLWPVAERLAQIVGTAPVHPPSEAPHHPPMSVRRLHLRQRLLSALGSGVSEQSEVAVAYRMADRNDGFLACLWQGAKEHFEEDVFKQLRPVDNGVQSQR